MLPRVGAPSGLGWWGRMIEAVPGTMLYNFDDSTDESTSVAGENPAVVSDLMARIERARQELGDIDRVGSGARFFDEGPRKLQVPIKRKPRRDQSSGLAK